VLPDDFGGAADDFVWADSVLAAALLRKGQGNDAHPAEKNRQNAAVEQIANLLTSWQIGNLPHDSRSFRSPMLLADLVEDTQTVGGEF
jgi:hypothetical protein